MFYTSEALKIKKQNMKSVEKPDHNWIIPESDILELSRFKVLKSEAPGGPPIAPQTDLIQKFSELNSSYSVLNFCFSQA